MKNTISPSPSLGIIGVGAFGEFMLKHLTPYFDITIFDAHRNLDDVKTLYRVQIGSITDVASCDVIVLAVPVRKMEDTIKNIAPHLRAGQLVIEVASVKVLPDQFLKSHLPAGVDAVGLHPLFGPQSGKYGIHGFNIALCNVHGARDKCVAEFLKSRLGLNVYETTPEDHDRQMAYVQLLTHLIGKAFVKINPPNLNLTTKTYDLLCDMVELIRYDSDELFKAIQTDNPYAKDTKESFFTAVRELEELLKSS